MESKPGMKANSSLACSMLTFTALEVPHERTSQDTVLEARTVLSHTVMYTNYSRFYFGLAALRTSYTQRIVLIRILCISSELKHFSKGLSSSNYNLGKKIFINVMKMDCLKLY